MTIEPQHPSGLPRLASRDGGHQGLRSRTSSPRELTGKAKTGTRAQLLANARHANRIPTGHTPQIDVKRPRRANRQAVVALNQTSGQAHILEPHRHLPHQRSRCPALDP